MRSTRKAPAASIASPPSKPLYRNRANGFSLVEVMITALLIGIGLLGLAALQGRVISYTTDAIQRSTAAMLAADLLELMRATPNEWSLYLQGATPPSPGASDCNVPANLPQEQLACWQAEVATLLPGSLELPTRSTYVCRSPTAGRCAQQGSAIEIQVAWKGALGECPSPHAHCLVRLRSEL